MSTIISQEIVPTYDNRIELHIDTKGNLQYLPRNAQMVAAHFGTFQRTTHSTLLYTAEIYPGEHDYESEYQDDLNALQKRQIEVVY